MTVKDICGIITVNLIKFDGWKFIMAASADLTRTYNINIEKFLTVIHDFSFTQALKLQFVSEYYINGGVTFTFHHGVSFTSWGETITLTVIGIQNCATNLIIHSECAVPTQFIDWGKNNDNVMMIANYLEQTVPFVPDSAPARTTCFCRNCGTEINIDAKFCYKCGAQKQ